MLRIGAATGEGGGDHPQCNFGHFSKSPKSADFFKGGGGGSDIISLLQA